MTVVSIPQCSLAHLALRTHDPCSTPALAAGVRWTFKAENYIQQKTRLSPNAINYLSGEPLRKVIQDANITYVRI